MYFTNEDRCYVDKSNTCKDETPSKSRPGWVWSCEACDSELAVSSELRESEPESSELRESQSESSELRESELESQEENGKKGHPTQTCLIIVSE